MLVPTPKWLDTGSNAWQMAAATFVGLQSVPGLVILYGGIVKRKWAINSAFMALYAFAAVMIVWVLWAYNMSFGPQMFPFWGTPQPALSAAFLLGQATIPAAASGMPPLAFPMSTMMFFQFVFAAITVIILAGSLIGRMSFKAWIIFVPVWMTFVYTVGCFSIWGGGWLAQLGALDFSGGYVIHLAAGTSGFVAAAVIGPRIQADRDHFPPNSLLMALAGAGILWLGWNGFNGGDPYFANADASAAILNTNLCTCVALLGLDDDGLDGLRQAVGGRRHQRHDRRPRRHYPGGGLCQRLGRDHHRHLRRHHPLVLHEQGAEYRAVPAS